MFSEQLKSLIYCHPTLHILICTKCASCFPTSASKHVYLHHMDTETASLRDLKTFFDKLFTGSHLITDQYQLMKIRPNIEDGPVPFLKVYYDGLLCLLCHNAGKHYICRKQKVMSIHLREAHNLRCRGRGRTVKAAGGLIEHWVANEFVRSPIACQTLFATSRLRYFAVKVPDAISVKTARPQHRSPDDERSRTEPSDIPATVSLRDQVELELAEALRPANGSCSNDPAVKISRRSEQSGWFDLTEWQRFFDGMPLGKAARLVDLPVVDGMSARDSTNDRLGEPTSALTLILDSFGRVLETAKASLKEGRLNIFDQHRVNSFIPARTSRRPLLHKLTQSTYDKYTKVFKRLLCYVYRLEWEKCEPRLHYRLTDDQNLALTDTIRRAHDLQGALEEQSASERSYALLDSACLVLCVSLLDHTLYGDIYDSIVVGFLAALAIEETHDGKVLPQPRLCEAVRYTGHLSAFIKISQLLVAQRALLAVELDQADYPATALDNMMDRFMAEGTRSPICWARKLRAYGKAIKDTTTSVGHIAWSDDGETILYRDTNLSMTQLRKLVSAEIETAQRLLAEVLLIHLDEDRENVVPAISLRSLVDNPAESTPGWSFVQHPQNQTLHGHDKWLLNRILDNEWLQKDFFYSPGRPLWRHHTVHEYLLLVEKFLEQLLLIIQLTGGQPTPSSSNDHEECARERRRITSRC